MGYWQVNADTLAGSRFVISPLAETTAALRLLQSGRAAHPGERTWLDTHTAAFHAHLAAHPLTARLLEAATSPRWTADFFGPRPPQVPAPAFDDELAVLRATPPDVAHADIAVTLRGPLPEDLRRDDLAEHAADLFAWVWHETVLPTWEHRRRVLEADIVARTRQLSQGGWAAALDTLSRGLRWLGDGRLQINTWDHPPRRISGARLAFLPVTPRTGFVTWDEPHHYAVVYPCTGVLTDTTRASDPLRALLGSGRAEVLALLANPLSTTHLVGLTGQALGSVGRHLKVLYDAGLVDRRRAGRSVLYYRTALGDALAAEPEGR